MTNLNRRLDFKAAIAASIMLALGAIVIWISVDLGLGGLRRMGPGFYPLMLGIAAVALGIGILAFEGWSAPQEAEVFSDDVVERPESETPWPGARWRPLVLIPLSIAVFGGLVERAGLVVAVVSLVIISGLAAPRPNLRRLAIVTLVTPLGVWLIFVKALDLPFKLF